MICKSCGAELKDGANFCESCGTSVEEAVVAESVEEVATDFTSEVSNEPARQEIVNEELPFDTKEFKENQEKSKKNGKAVKWILIILGILLVAAGLVFAYFKFFGKESYEKSVDSMEKAVENLVKKENTSGTIKAKLSAVMGTGSDKMNLNFAATVKYAKEKDKYSAYLKVDKTMFTDEMEVYVEADETNVTAYTTGALLNLIADIGSEYDETWFKYSMDLSSMGLDFSEYEGNEEIDLSDLLTKDNFKFVDKKGGLKHYVLTLTDEDLKELSDDVEDTDLVDTDMFDLSGKNFKVDFYLSNNNELKKIEIDFKEAFKEELAEADISKLLFTIEFENMNSTKVEVPAEVKLNSIDVSDVGTSTTPTYSYDYDTEDIYYDVMLSASVETCMSEEFVVDFKNYDGRLALDDDYYDAKRIQSGKINFTKDPDGGIYCVVTVTEPIVIDGKTCVKDTTSYSEYAGICN